MKKHVQFLSFFLAAAILMSAAGCSQSKAASSTAATTTIEKIKADGYVTMSTNAEFEPFEFKDGDNFTGIDIDISNKVAEKLGVKLKINDVAFSALTMELNTGKADFVAAGMTEDPDKKKNVDFSEAYFDASQSIIVQKGSPIKTRTDLNGKKVGVQNGTTSDKYCTNEDGTSDIKVAFTERYSKSADAITDLMNGKIDAVVVDDYPAKKFVEKNADKLVKLNEALTVEKYAIAVKKGDAEMLKIVNEVLKDLKSSGELNKIFEKYTASLVG
jgi:ABC-type amino acid transport substrate-binding protein